MEERLDKCVLADTFIEAAKVRLGIEKPNSDMTDDDIALVMRFLGSGAPDTMWFDDKPIYGRVGIGTMLSLTLYVFPDFYERHELSQLN